MAAVSVVAIAAGAAVVAGLLARGELVRARGDLVAGREALLRADAVGARAAFDRAEASLARAHRRLDGWSARPGRLLPVLHQNLGVEAALVAGGRQVAAAGHLGATIADELPLDGRSLAPGSQGGAVALDPIVAAGRVTPRIVAHLAAAQRIVATSSSAGLAPAVRRARADALGTVADARARADAADAVAFLVPRLLGSEGRRRLLVGAENSAELRGRGGYIGSIGLLETDHGRLHMGSFMPTTDLPPLVSVPADSLPSEYRHYVSLGALNSWPNLTMSPDFSSAAPLLLERLRASGGPAADGLIATDPTALSYLLAATGPVAVDGVPEPITEANVQDWALNRAYVAFPDDRARKEILGRIASAVWNRVAAGEGVDGRRLANAVSRSLAERHAVLYSADRAEQAVIHRVRADGALSTAPGDYLLVLGQNLGENKMDYYVRRQVTYTARILADGTMESRVVVVARNLAEPGSAIPDYVGGARPDIGLPAASARTYLSVFLPAAAEVQGVRRQGAPDIGYDNRAELGKRLVGTVVDIGPGQAQEVEVRYRVPHAVGPGGYHLTLQHQATVAPDDWSVTVEAPGRNGSRAWRWAGPLVADRRIGG